jgi:hypothetical protein
MFRDFLIRSLNEAWAVPAPREKLSRA